MVEFEVPFVAGQARPRFVRATGRAYKSGRDASAEAWVADAYRAAGGGRTDGPVAVLVDCFRPLPKGAPRREGARPYVVKPDADNVAKLVLDGLNGVAWADDAQVVALRVVKHHRRRGEAERTRVRVMAARECVALVGQDLEDFEDNDGEG